LKYMNKDNKLRKTGALAGAGHRITAYSKTSMLLLVLFCLSSATVGWTALAVPAEAAQDIPPAAAPVLKGPLIRADVASISEFSFGQDLNVEMTVENYGDVTARNVRIFSRQSPAGYFYTVVADQPSVPMNANDQRVGLDDLAPAEWKIIHFSIHSPQSSQIKGEWSHKFYFNFTYSFDTIAETKLAAVTLSTRPGKILVDTSVFAK
jgi:hypothetical protein